MNSRKRKIFKAIGSSNIHRISIIEHLKEKKKMKSVAWPIGNVMFNALTNQPLVPCPVSQQEPEAMLTFQNLEVPKAVWSYSRPNAKILKRKAFPISTMNIINYDNKPKKLKLLLLTMIIHQFPPFFYFLVMFSYVPSPHAIICRTKVP